MALDCITELHGNLLSTPLIFSVYFCEIAFCLTVTTRIVSNTKL